MSMNNEYYSTCWWLSRVPVIKSAKALLSNENARRLRKATDSPFLRARNRYRRSTTSETGTDDNLMDIRDVLWCSPYLKTHVQPLKQMYLYIRGFLF